MSFVNNFILFNRYEKFFGPIISNSSEHTIQVVTPEKDVVYVENSQVNSEDELGRFFFKFLGTLWGMCDYQFPFILLVDLSDFVINESQEGKSELELNNDNVLEQKME